MAHRVSVVGEVLVDLLWKAGASEVVPAPGGSPANVAIGLRRLGRPTTLVTSWGDDPPGTLVAGHLRRAGVPVRRAPGGGRTMLALAYLDAAGSATYDFLAAWDPTGLAVPGDTTILHTGSLAIVVEPGASRVLELCRDLRARPGRAVVIDLNVRPAVQPDPAAYRDACLRFVEVADVVKASDEDLRLLYPGLDAAEAARALLSYGPRLAVVTLGPGGAFAVTAGAEVRVPAPVVAVRDTVGAGDAFQAALLDALAARDPAGDGADRLPLPAGPADLARVLTRCVTAAALTCTRVGADPPTAAELEDALSAGTGSADE
ncbi:carbohydrate kinase [Actinomadura viridis]|uniref:Fructokinase n=1 Tax=Actinomadura viridis TaxID=58110 RepID=A0A931DSC4_9ACTN|nr:PfkB family carbohydrate kinase [Actinomadura viridis]MBG6091808.1 fructokinase [Actinomadura viridis]